MGIRREPSEEEYDVVVVGSGMGGLSAAALLAAKCDKKVLVIERHDRPGGYAHSFYRNRYHFDAAIHVTAGCGHIHDNITPANTSRKGLIELLLNTLGVQDKCKFLKVHPFYSTIFPGFRLDVPSDKERFVDAHSQHFPKEKEGLNEIVRLCFATGILILQIRYTLGRIVFFSFLYLNYNCATCSVKYSLSFIVSKYPS